MRNKRSGLICSILSFFAIFATTACFGGNVSINSNDSVHSHEEQLDEYNYDNPFVQDIVETEALEQDKLLVECSKDIEFKIYSYESITNDNLYSYCVVLDNDRQMVELGVKPVLDYYLVYKNGLYTECMSYDIYLASGVYFKDYGKSVKHVQFCIDGEEKEVCEYNKGIVQVTYSEIAKAEAVDEETTKYTLKTVPLLNNGDVVAFVDETVDDLSQASNLQYIKVSDYKKVGTNYVIEAVDAEIDDVFDEVDIYKIQDVEFTDEDLSGEVTENVEKCVKNDPRVKLLENRINDSSPKEASKKEFEWKLSVKRTDDNGVSFTAAGTIKISKNVKVSVSLNFIVKPKIVASVKLKDGKLTGLVSSVVETESYFTFSGSVFDDGNYTAKQCYLFDRDDDHTYAKAVEMMEDPRSFEEVNFKNTFESLGNTMSSWVKSWKEAELSVSNSKDSVLESFVNMFGNGESYGEVYRPNSVLNLLLVTFPIGPVEVGFELGTFVNCKISGTVFGQVYEKEKVTTGIDLNVTILGKNKTKKIQEKESETKLVVGGLVQVDFQGGLNMNLTFSFTGLTRVLNLYFEFKVGPYIEIQLFGMIQVTFDDGPKFVVQGGFMFEVGLGMSGTIGLKVWKFKIQLPDLTFRIPLPFCSLGDPIMPISFYNDNDSTSPYITKDATFDITKAGLTKIVGYNAGKQKFSIFEGSTHANSKLTVQVASEDADKATLDENRILTIHNGVRDVIKLKVSYDQEWSPKKLSASIYVQYGPESSGTSTNPKPVLPTSDDVFDYTMSADSSSYIVTGYHGSGNSVVIPETFNGLPIVEVEDILFKNNTTIETISMPSIKVVGDSAFEGCKKLTNITAPSLEETGADTFKGCSMLESIGETKSLKFVGGRAFKDCAHLTSIDLSNCETIKFEAFSGCSHITAITVSNSLNKIGDYAFENCVSLVRFAISNRTEIDVGYNVFYGCNALQIFVDVADRDYYSDVFFQYEDLILVDGMFTDEYAFELIGVNKIRILRYFGGQKSVDVPSKINGMNVVEIGDECFKNTNVTSVVIPETVDRIDTKAFCYNSSRVTLTILGDRVVECGAGLFMGTSKYTIKVPSNVLHEYKTSRWRMYSNITAL